MRKAILTILLAAGVALPAMAQDQGGRHHNRDERNDASQSDDTRPARPERNVRVEGERPQVMDRATWSDRGAERQRAVEQQQAHQPVAEQRGERQSWQRPRLQDSGVFADTRRQFRERAASGSSDGQQLRRDVTTRDGLVIRQDGYGTRNGDMTVRRRTGDRTSNYAQTNTSWNNQWRGDNHYDWRRYRDRNRSVYRLGYYRDPYGSRYRRFSIGFSLFPSYYQSNYWLDDPFMYRLPPAYGPYRWIRYYGDALLVNIYTGQVVDVVHDFFW